VLRIRKLALQLGRPPRKRRRFAAESHGLGAEGRAQGAQRLFGLGQINPRARQALLRLRPCRPSLLGLALLLLARPVCRCQPLHGALQLRPQQLLLLPLTYRLPGCRLEARDFLRSAIVA